MWVIDIRHWLDESLTGPGLPQLKFKVQKLGEIITYATAIEATTPALIILILFGFITFGIISSLMGSWFLRMWSM